MARSAFGSTLRAALGRHRSSEPVPYTGQHVGAEAAQEALLIVAGAVEDEMLKADLDVGDELLDHLIWIIGDDETSLSPVEDLVRRLLHLDRVVDTRLLVRSERERGPEVAGFLGVGEIRVVADLDLDVLVDIAGVAPRLLRAGREALQHVAVELGVLARGSDEAITYPSGQLGREWA